MSKRFVRIFLSAFIIITACFLLVSGSDILDYPLIEDPYVPAGNLITWMGLISWTLFFNWIIPRPASIIRVALGICLGLSIFWPLVAYGMAGNWRFAFPTDKGLSWFLTYSGVVVVLPIMIASFSISLSLMKRLEQTGKKQHN